MTWVSPITRGEAYLGALALWSIGWVLVALRSRARRVVPILAVSVLAGVYGRYVSALYERPVALILNDSTALRAAPYGSAQDLTVLDQGSAVEIARTDGDWVMVIRRGTRGWVRRQETVQF